jgi:hypothetical protein
MKIGTFTASPVGLNQVATIAAATGSANQQIPGRPDDKHWTPGLVETARYGLILWGGQARQATCRKSRKAP